MVGDQRASGMGKGNTCRPDLVAARRPKSCRAFMWRDSPGVCACLQSICERGSGLGLGLKEGNDLCTCREREPEMGKEEEEKLLLGRIKL